MILGPGDVRPFVLYHDGRGEWRGLGVVGCVDGYLNGGEGVAANWVRFVGLMFGMMGGLWVLGCFDWFRSVDG